MKKISVLALVGGISEHSLNLELFESIRSIDHDLEFISTEIAKLPFFSQDHEVDPPKDVLIFKEQIRQADAVLFITPEYNRSIPGVLKNAIDWGSRPMGQNCWESLPAAIMGASMSRLGTYSAQAHLRLILNYLNMRVMAQPEFCLTPSSSSFLKAKEYFRSEKIRGQAEKFLSAFKEWIEFLGEKETNFIKVKSSLFSYSQEV